jgi:hypothetical protein
VVVVGVVDDERRAREALREREREREREGDESPRGKR